MNATADNATQSLIFTAASPMEVTQSESSNSTIPPAPPLPLATFSVQLPSVLQEEQQVQQHQQSKVTNFADHMLNSDNNELESAMLLSPQSVQQGSPDPQRPQEITTSDSTNLDLKVIKFIKNNKSCNKF